MFAARRLPSVAAAVQRRASFAALSLRQASSSTTPSTTAAKNIVLDPEVPGFREPGQVPTNYELAAGLERYEYLKTLKGEDPWEDMHPIVLTKKGTAKEPIVVRGVDPERYVGCTGFPADSHEAVWLTVRPHGKVDRCPHCGNVFKYIREEDHHH
ncbi:cytochrome c oxidase subunit VB-domain-containing protein [Entophlyctis helioformis]|nr:cytochrome c oxidase subunit VB-domain-containing protein [Entophlyctis helioformis]